jgi:hypothetical protein
VADLIQSLWIGPRLSAMEQLTIRSYLHHGHEFHLYVYDRPDGVPPGTTVRDANEILPRSMIFTYREHDSVSGFSNFFRYKLLLERGGWWVDTDQVCLRPFAADDEHVFASEPGKDGRDVICAGAIHAPRGSDAMRFAWETCKAKDTSQLKWGEAGPRLVAQAVERFGLQQHVRPSRVFCAIGDADWDSVIGERCPPLPPDALGIHLWNERWRRAGCDKDAAYPASSLYERLKRRYGAAPARGEESSG